MCKKTVWLKSKYFVKVVEHHKYINPIVQNLSASRKPPRGAIQSKSSVPQIRGILENINNSIINVGQ